MSKPLDLSYRKNHGILYPEIQISNNLEADRIPLGKYGQICLNFLKEEYPERYTELKMNGDLMPLMHKVNEEAHRQVKDLTEKLVAENSETDQSDTIQMFRLRNTCQASAEEMVLSEFVYQPR